MSAKYDTILGKIREKDAGGEKGDPGVDATGAYESAITSLTTGTITHNLNRKPAVVIVDTSGNEVEGQITYLNNTQLTLTFSIPITGVVYCT